MTFENYDHVSHGRGTSQLTVGASSMASCNVMLNIAPEEMLAAAFRL